MKKIKYLFILLAVTAIVSCSASQTGKADKAGKKQEKANAVQQKIQEQNFVFEAQQAIPMGMKNRILTGDNYTVKVTKDSVDVYLPYFGRAYSAPIGESEGGIKFISTDFDYKADKQTKNGWNITINVKSEPKHNYRLSFSISSSGSATLTVNDNTRQSITFHGKLSD